VINFDLIKNDLIKHEGLALKAYKLKTSNLFEDFYTIGYGHKLDKYQDPITVDEAERLLDLDIKEAYRKAKTLYPLIDFYHPNIQRFLIEMAYNLGWNLKTFVKANRLLRLEQYDEAISEYKNSLWYKQVGSVRADEMLSWLKDI
jgi:GH24 family phage-related lysozyme (muramidase)